MTRHDPTFLPQKPTYSYTPGNIRKALVQLSQTLANPSPCLETSAILKILENPVNPDSDNHHQPITHTPKMLPFPAASDRITRALGMQRLGPTPEGSRAARNDPELFHTRARPNDKSSSDCSVDDPQLLSPPTGPYLPVHACRLPPFLVQSVRHRHFEILTERHH